MDTDNKKPKELQIALTPEQAGGQYCNFTVISHGPDEFFLDFIAMAPNTPQPKVQSRIVMTPQNAKNLMAALIDNVKKYEATFGEIKRITPIQNPGELPNPFMNGGKLN